MFLATSGTVKRTGKKIEVNVSGEDIEGGEVVIKNLTATINVATVVDL